MDRIIDIYNTMLLGLSTIAATISLAIGIGVPQNANRTDNSMIDTNSATFNQTDRQENNTQKPATSFIELKSENSGFSISDTDLARINKTYNIKFFDIDAAKDKTAVKSSTVSASISSTIQYILNTAKINANLAESYSIVLMAPQETKSNKVIATILKEGKSIPIRQSVGLNENLQFDMFHKYILLRSTMNREELALAYIRALSLIIVHSLTADQFMSYMKIRNMNSQHVETVYGQYNKYRSGEPVIHVDSWKEEPDQDFAEMFITLYADPNHKIKTIYGKVTNQSKDWFIQNITPLYIQK